MWYGLYAVIFSKKVELYHDLATPWPVFFGVKYRLMVAMGEKDGKSFWNCPTDWEVLLKDVIVFSDSLLL